MRTGLLFLALILATTAEAQPVSLAVVADVERLATLPMTLAAVMAQGPTALILAGDVDHRNPQTLKAMTAMHGGVKAALGAAGVTVPVLSIWDDHDFCRNNASRNCPTRSLAIDTWSAQRPMCPDHGLPEGIWQRCVLADGFVEVYLLDGRCCRDPRWSSRSMLGPQQAAWLEDRLRVSAARWKVIVSGVTFNSTVYNDGDTWAGYRASKDELIAMLDGIPGVLFVSGDLHGGGLTDGEYSGRPELNVPRGTEDTFVAGCAACGLWTLKPPVEAGFGWVELTDTEATLGIRDTNGALRVLLGGLRP